MSGTDHNPAAEGVRLSDAKLQLLIAEYQWVAGLIRYYREVELKALAGTGLVLSGVAAAYTALLGASRPNAVDEAGVTFAIASAITAFILPVVLMAQLRGIRAVVYVRECLHSRAIELTQDPKYLAWEKQNNALFEQHAPRTGVVLRRLLSASVVVALVGAASLLLAVAGATIHATDASRAIAGAAAASDLFFLFLGLRLASRSEGWGQRTLRKDH